MDYSKLSLFSLKKPLLVLVVRAEGVKFLGLLCPTGPTLIQALSQLFFEPGHVRMQQGSDSFGPHIYLGTQLVEGQLEHINLCSLSLSSCLVL